MAISVQVTAGKYMELRRVPPQSVLTLPNMFSIQYEFGFTGNSTRSRMTLLGVGFTYTGLELTGGTIEFIDFQATSYPGMFGPTPTYGGREIISGLSVDAHAFMAAYNAEDWAALSALIFSGPILFSGYDDAATDFASWADAFDAGPANDTLLGGIGNDTLRAYAGDDYINGGSGDDVLIADAGADVVFGGLGSDAIWTGDGNDTVLAGDGSDIVYGDTGDDLLFGEAGNDTLLAGDGDDFAAGGADNDYVAGEAGTDYLMGEAGADTLSGGAGNDVMVAGAGADALFADDGSDALFGGIGNDYYVGGAGTDYFYALHDGPIAGELDIIDGFEVWTSGTADYLVLPAAYQSATSIFDQGGYTWVATPAGGGTHYVAITGANAAFVTAQTVWI